jgi:catechol 2,3-dioxygenase-like lactoylglutathione lyase family enzyme
MKRLHVHLAVTDLAQSVRFYSGLFGSEPSVLKHDYAKWMLDDPRVNFAVSVRGHRPGLDHLGIQAEAAGELDEVARRLKAAGRPVIEQRGVSCCYARSDKAWVTDPEGISWESFFTHGESTVYGEDLGPRAADGAAEAMPAHAAACCSPSAAGCAVG